MEIVDLGPDNQELFCLCLEDWSDEAREAGPTRSQWCQRQQPHLRAKLAKDDQGHIGAMIQYLPIEHSLVKGEGLYFIPCIWVHGHKQGRGDFQKRGMGQALLQAAEQDARELGATGMAAWGILLPFWMRAKWFKKHGYKKVQRQGMAVLLWKPFEDSAVPPSWYPKKKFQPLNNPHKVTVTAYVNGWCLAQNLVYQRAKRAAAEFGEKVDFREIDTSTGQDIAVHGQTDAVFIDGKAVRSGPPASYESIYKLLQKRVKRLG